MQNEVVHINFYVTKSYISDEDSKARCKKTWLFPSFFTL